ncbi:MAG: hypothetical protein QXI84_04290 [Thermofilaceae archaeon]
MYEVAVKDVGKPFKVPEDAKKRLMGISPKMLSKMRREAVDCPVLGREVPFVECYICPNFVRRVRGRVHCRGLPLT